MEARRCDQSDNMPLKSCTVIVHPLTRSNKDAIEKSQLEEELRIMGANVVRQRRNPSLTHIVLSRNPRTDPVDAEKENEEVFSLACKVAEVRH
jgi:hypothetical protein